MKLKPIQEIKTADEARQIAIDWQSWQSEQSLSWSKEIEYQDYFIKLADKFGLTTELQEIRVSFMIAMSRQKTL